MKLNAIAAALAATTLAANAAVLLTFEQVGADVVTTYAGTINTTALTKGINLAGSALQRLVDEKKKTPAVGTVQAYQTLGAVTLWTGFSQNGDDLFTFTGSNEIIASDSQAGTAFGFQDSGIWLPQGYISGSPIAGSVAFHNLSLANLDVNAGNSKTGSLILRQTAFP